jgi:hypothetical protein
MGTAQSREGDYEDGGDSDEDRDQHGLPGPGGGQLPSVAATLLLLASDPQFRLRPSHDGGSRSRWGRVAGIGQEPSPVLPGHQGHDLGGEAVMQGADALGVDKHGGAPFVSWWTTARAGRSGLEAAEDRVEVGRLGRPDGLGPPVGPQEADADDVGGRLGHRPVRVAVGVDAAGAIECRRRRNSLVGAR